MIFGLLLCFTATGCSTVHHEEQSETAVTHNLSGLASYPRTEADQYETGRSPASAGASEKKADIVPLQGSWPPSNKRFSSTKELWIGEDSLLSEPMKRAPASVDSF